MHFSTNFVHWYEFLEQGPIALTSLVVTWELRTVSLVCFTYFMINFWCDCLPAFLGPYSTTPDHLRDSFNQTFYYSRNCHRFVPKIELFIAHDCSTFVCDCHFYLFHPSNTYVFLRKNSLIFEHPHNLQFCTLQGVYECTQCYLILDRMFREYIKLRMEGHWLAVL